MSNGGETGTSVFGMPLPACLIEAVEDRSWMDLAASPRIEKVFGHTPVRPRFLSVSGMVGMTKWWREELDEETLECYSGTSEAAGDDRRMSRTQTVIIGNLGPDLPFVLDYRESPVDPSVAFLGEGDSWQKVSANVCDLLRALDPQRTAS